MALPEVLRLADDLTRQLRNAIDRSELPLRSDPGELDRFVARLYLEHWAAHGLARGGTGA